MGLNGKMKCIECMVLSRVGRSVPIRTDFKIKQVRIEPIKNRTGSKLNRFDWNQFKIKPVRIEPIVNQFGSNRTGLITSYKTSFFKKSIIKKFYILIFRLKYP